LLLVLAILLRRMWRHSHEAPDVDIETRDAHYPTASGFNVMLAVAFCTILGLEVFGIAQHGDFKASLWQTQKLFWLPVLAWIFQSTLRGPRDQVILGILVVVATTIKTIEGLWYYEVICKPLNVKPAYVTTHSDSLLFVTTIMIGFVGWLL